MALPEWFRAAAKKTGVVVLTVLALGYVTAEPYSSFAGMGAVLLLFAAFEVLDDHTDIVLPPGTTELTVGFVASAVCLSWIVLDGFDPFPGVFAAFGAWALLDGAQQYRRGDAPPDRGYAREADGVYYADESQFGRVAFVRRTLGGAVRRFLRPFRG